MSDNIRAFANYTLNNSEILEDAANPNNIGNEFAFAGTDFFNIGLAYENRSGVYVGLFLRRVGDRITTTSGGDFAEPYTNVDIRARYPISDNVNLTASWENVFDEDFVVFEGFGDTFPGVGSRFQIGLNAKFR